MATVSGRVVFDRNRSATIDAGDSGIENIPVILQDTTTNVGLVVLTNANGEYEFTNVPAGNYRIVESYGNTGGVSTPGDFDTAAAMPFAIGANPPIDFVTNPPTGSTNLDSLTPNTLLVTITDSDLTNQNFLNGPVIYTPIQNLLDPCASVSDTNLINAANNGTFGFFSQGTPANTGAPVEPYPGVTPDFTYVLPDPTEYTPFDGEYTIQNIMNDAFSNEIGAWWRIADHTTGNETGRMMVVNGFEPGAVFFRDIVAVQPNTNYLFTAWILNLFRATGYPDPALGVRIIGEDGDILYSQTLGAQIPVNTNAPEWKEIGTVVNSGDNINITVEFVSEGPAVIGNDYAVDDISLNEIDVPLFTPVKTINTPVANVGDTVTYTVTLENTCSSSLTDVFFTDIVPDGLEFLPGSVTINNSPDLTADPNNGFELPDIPGGDIATVTFNAIVTDIPTINPTPNQATITYSYTPVEGGIPAINTVDSNIALLEVMEQEEADISVIKSASQDPVAPGEELTYTIVVTNNGPNAAENVELIDDIPDSIINPEYSIDEGATFTPWEGTLDLGTLADGESQTILIRGIVSDIIPGTITNTATVTSTTTDPNPDNNTATVNINVENEPVADVSVTKIPNTFQVERGEILTYRIVIANNGPDAAENVTLTDDIPSTIIDPEYSIDEGATFTPWEGTLDLGTLPAYRTQAILIRGTISDTATGTITNTAVVATTTTDSNPNNNTYTVDVSFPPEADISVVKSASQDPVAPGEELTYTIVVTNNGPDTAQLITVLDEVNLISPEYSIDEGATFNQWRGGLDIETLAAGESQTILIRGRVLFRETGTISNTVSVSSITPPDPDLSNNTDTVIVQVEEADISVVKSASQDPVARGEVLTYTIVVTNNGPFDAENVVLTDNILDSIIDPEYSIDEGATFTPWEGTLDLGTLLAGDSQTILIRGIVSDEATGTITNTATVTSTTSDPNPDNNTSVVDVEVEPEADIAVVKIAGPNPIQRGELLTYTIVVTNDGPDAAENVVLTDNILDSIIDTEYSIDGGTTFTPWEGTLDLGTLLAGESQTILIRGTVSDTATGPIANTATVTSTTSDPNPDNNTSAVDVDIVPEADVSVVKSASPNPVQPEQILTYTIVVSNNGPDVAEDVVLIDNILSSIINPEFSVDGGTTFTPWTGSFDIGTFAAGEEETILIRGAVSETLAETITNTATVSLTTLDPNLDNNTSEVNVQISQGEADVSVVKSASPNPVQRGELLTYTIVVTNDGPDAARGVRLNESLPFSLLNPEFSLDNGASFQPLPPFYPISLGTIEAGGTRDVIVRATVSDEATGIITNVARATSTTPDPNINNNESAANVEVEAADISVVKSASPNPVEQGEELTYIIVVTNNGPNASEDVILTDDIPDSIIAPEFSIDGGLTFNPWTGSIDLGTLVDGESRVVLIRGAVSDTSTGTITNTATVTSTTLDTNLDNNTFTVDVDIEEEVQADISVEKSATPDTVSPGEELIYTILVTNNGPDNAENVVLTDNIPITIINPEFSIDEGGTFTPWTGSLDLGTLASGEARTVLIRGTVPDTAAGIITNTAVLQSTTPDPDLNNNVSTVNVGVEEEQADISVEKIPDRNTVEPGDELTYTLFLQNNGPNDAENVVLTDNIPLGIIDPEFSIDGGGTFTPWTGSLDLGTLLNGESRAILIRGTVSDTAAGTITNTAVLQSTTLDPDISNNVSTINTEVLEEPQAQADILVEKTASPDTVSPGEMLTYTILVTNNGPDNAENVILTDNIPPSIINPEFSIDGGALTPWTGNIDLGILASGETRTVLITGIVSEEATGTLTNTATVISTTLDPDPNNNVSTVNVEVIEEPQAQADILVEKSASPNPVEQGEELTYTILVTNNGPNDAENVVLTDNIPPSIINPEFSIDGGALTPWTGNLDLGTLLSGETRTVLITGIVSDEATGTLTNTATVISTTLDPDPNNNVSTVNVEVLEEPQAQADILVEKIASPNPVEPGDILTYTILVTNNGPNDAENVVLTDNIPPSIINPEFSIDGGALTPWTGNLDLGTLPSGETRTVLITGIVSDEATGTLTNTATVISTTLDPDPNNNVSTVNVEVLEEAQAQADILVEKSASPNIVAPGDELTYTLFLQNNGPNDAENVVLTDNIPPGIINPEFSIDGGALTPWTGNLDLGTLPSGETRTVLITGIVSDEATGTLTNTATVISTTLDPDPNNNVSTVNVEVLEEAQAQADILVEKSASPNIVAPGDELTYTLFLQNNGPNDAENVVLTDNIPPGIIDPEFSVDGGGIFTPWIGSIDLGTLVDGESRAILIRGTVSDEAVGTITNTATVISTTLDPDPNNNVSTVNVEVIEEPQAQADILVEKSASPNPVEPGDILTYTILVTNNGPNDAENVVLTDNIPPSIINPEFSIDGGALTPWTGNIDLGILASGETRTVLITGIVSEEATGTLTNTATVISTTLDPDPNNNVSTVNTEVEEEPSEAQADISVAKMASPNPVEPGEELTYTVVVTNNGPDDAENVILTDNIPDSVINPEYSLNGGMTFTPWEGTLDLGTVESEELDIILIRGTVSDTATGCINNTAIVTSTTPDPNLVNNVSSICVEVNTAEEEADISVVKTANCKKACIGENLKFTITVTNAGPADAQNVTLIDNVENILKKAVFSLDDGVTWNLWTGRLAIGTLEAGSTRVILLKGIVKPSCACKITNIVDVMSTTLDPNLNNNTSTVMVKIKKCC